MRHLAATWPLSFLGLVLLTVLSGCANPVIYNAGRDGQAQAALKAAEAVDLVSTVEQIQAKYKALSALEQQTQRGRRATTRDFEIAFVAAASPDGAASSAIRVRYVQALLEPRFQALVGTVPTPESLNAFEPHRVSRRPVGLSQTGLA